MLMSQTKKRYNITAPPELWEQARQEAYQNGQKLSSVIQRLLALWLEGKADLSEVDLIEFGNKEGN